MTKERVIPPYPTGNISREIGEAYCEKLADECFSELFDEELGDFNVVTADFIVKPGHEKFLKVHPCAKVPYGIAKEFKEELDKLNETCIPVDGRGLKVATQIVPVVKKKDGKIKVRLCGNYKHSLNPHILDEPHQFVSMNDQLDKLKGEHYTCLDVKGAYKQIKVGVGGELLTLTTPEGFKQPTRLQYGVKTAPKHFQKGMDEILQGFDGKGPIPNTACVVDDICITGSTPQEHFSNLIELFKRLSAAGLKLNRDKCKFYQKEVKFLGKIIDRNGQRIDPATVDAILNMPAPTDKHKLRSFLGHMSYVGRHMADVRTARAPLDALLKKDIKFVWEEVHDKAFRMCKQLASNPATLAHYNEELPLVLTTDASPFGLGACLAHRVTENGKTFLRPISYASCSLKPSEKNYAQIDREGLAVVWAMRYFKQFVLGKHIELHTDCSALIRIFGEKNKLGGCVTGRLNRWAIVLMEFDFTAKHIKGSTNKICDSLSRLPVAPKGELLAKQPSQVGQAISSEDLAKNMSINSVKYAEIDSANGIMDVVQCLAQLPEPKVETVTIHKTVGTSDTKAWNVLPLTAKDIAKATREDRVLGKLLREIRTGEISKTDVDMKPFVSIFSDLYIENDIIFQGQRIIIPAKQQQRLLFELHLTHTGIVKMKEVARRYFWWPKVNQEIEDIAKNCTGCNKYRKKPGPAPLCSWPYALRPMERVHIDFCEFKGKMLLVMIDAYSKYIWVHVCNADTTAMKTLAVLYGWFTDRNGFPATIVSDNGPQFTSGDFADKMHKWGIKHILTPPYHPASNGLAEKAVGIVKDKLKKMNSSANPFDLYVNLQDVQRQYRATPHTSTGQTPYELISSAPIPVMFPHLVSTQKKIQETRRSCLSKDSFGQARKFSVGDVVLVYDKLSKLNAYGLVKDYKSNNSYIVTINNVDKHISADNMTLMQKVNNNIIDSNDVNENTKVNFENNNNVYNDNIIFDNHNNDILEKDDLFSDTASIVSDFSDASEYEFNSKNIDKSNVYIIPARRKNITEIEKLNIGNHVLNLSKTRSGKV